jgi:hypothetical protein
MFECNSADDVETLVGYAPRNPSEQHAGMASRVTLDRRNVLRLAGAACASMAFVPIGRATAAEGAFLTAPAALLMVDAPACPYCRRWNAEIRQGYLNSAEGQFAPLVVRSVGHPDVRTVAGLVYTPTFVAYAKGREIGRIVGYQGADFFWAEVGSILRRGGFNGG